MEKVKINSNQPSKNNIFVEFFGMKAIHISKNLPTFALEL